MGTHPLSTLVLLFVFIGFSSFGQICMKLGLKGDVIPVLAFPRAHHNQHLQVYDEAVRACGVGAVRFKRLRMVVFALQENGVQLSVVFPMISIGYVVVTLLSVLILRERVQWKFAIAGLVCIAIGVACIGQMPGSR